MLCSVCASGPPDAAAAMRAASASSRQRPCSPAAGRGSSRSRPPTSVAPAARSSSASAPLATPPIPITGIDTASATAPTCCSATARTAGPESPPRPAPSQGRSGRRVDRRRLQRVDQRDRVGSALLGGDGDRRRVGDVGRQLHDQRLGGERPQRPQQRRGLLRLLADDQSRVDVGAGDVELERRRPRRGRRPPRRAGRTPRRSSPSPRRSAAPAARRAGAGRARGSPPGPCSAARSS